MYYYSEKIVNENTSSLFLNYKWNAWYYRLKMENNSKYHNRHCYNYCIYNYYDSDNINIQIERDIIFYVKMGIDYVIRL